MFLQEMLLLFLCHFFRNNHSLKRRRLLIQNDVEEVSERRVNVSDNKLKQSCLELQSFPKNVIFFAEQVEEDDTA